MNVRQTAASLELECEMAQVPRATRFPVVSRVLWRPHLRTSWSEAWSVNASQSGVLFRLAPESLDPLPLVGTPVDMIFGLSWGTLPLDAADVQCSGRVVRIESDPRESFVAATIDSYTFLKPR